MAPLSFQVGVTVGVGAFDTVSLKLKSSAAKPAIFASMNFSACPPPRSSITSVPTCFIAALAAAKLLIWVPPAAPYRRRRR